MNFGEEKKYKTEKINNNLNEYLCTSTYPEVLTEAMVYSVNAGGKRLRPLLLLSACEGVGGDSDNALPFACALEMIHTYSLIHDDLPVMDNDDYRRGKLTNHRVFGEAMALLAGDGLLNLAYETMAMSCMKNNEADIAQYGRKAEAMHEIASAAGRTGMVGGQVVDILSENKNVDESTLLYIHEHKTGALIRAAFGAGGILGGASGNQLEQLRTVGALFGLAFQIRDDILDVTGDRDKLGKPVKSDEKNNKITYVSIHGLNKAEADYQRFSREAVDILKDMHMQNSFLAELMDSLMNRDH